MSGLGADLRGVVDAALPSLRGLDEAASARAPAPGKWSPKELVGHLIDSAANNHQRFVRAADQPHLVFQGYDQDGWVVRQGYADAPWAELVDLWSAYNRHLARVIDAVPAELRARSSTRHNFDRICMRPVPADQPATLEYLMVDYVVHLRHHLASILPEPER